MWRDATVGSNVGPLHVHKTYFTSQSKLDIIHRTIGGMGVVSRHRFFHIALAAIVGLVSGSNAWAIDLSLTARAEAGLDPATREFLRTLPGEWRPQIAGIVDDAFNRADKSVATYLSQVDALITSKLTELQCTIIGTEKNVVDDIVKRFPFVKQTGPMEQLRSRIASDMERRKYTSSPTFIKDLYNDLMLATNFVSCQNFAVPTAKNDASKIMAGLSSKWLVWNRVESTGCTDVALPNRIQEGRG